MLGLIYLHYQVWEQSLEILFVRCQCGVGVDAATDKLLGADEAPEVGVFQSWGSPKGHVLIFVRIRSLSFRTTSSNKSVTRMT